MLCWVHRPKTCDSQLLPALFIHGVGFGAIPYLPMLLSLKRARDAPLLVVELPNISRTHYQAIMPLPASFRDVIERLLRQECGITEPSRYVLLGHSLGTDYCAMIMNDPRCQNGGSSVLLPARMVLMDPICFAHQIALAHRLPFWNYDEAVKRSAGLTFSMRPAVSAILYLVVRDESTQEATKRSLISASDCLLRPTPESLRRCPTLVSLSGKDQVVPAWMVRDYLSAQFPEIELRIDPGMEHGAFLMPHMPGWLVQCHFKDVVKFLSTASRVASHPTLSRGLEPPLKRKSRSDQALSMK